MSSGYEAIHLLADSWNEQVYSGRVDFAKDTQVLHHTPSALRIEAGEQSEGGAWKEVPLAGGKTYVVDTWVRAEGAARSSYRTLVTPMRDGKSLQISGRDMVYENTDTQDTAEYTRMRVYFEAPREADAIRIEHRVKGAAKVWFTDTSVEERLGWRERIGRYSSADTVHPMKGSVQNMFAAWQWSAIKSEDAAAMREKTAPLLAASEQELMAAARLESDARSHLDVHPEYEAMIRRLAMLYRQTGDETYARRSILIMLQFAEGYPGVPKRIKESVQQSYGKFVPMDALYGYDLIYHSPEWEKLGEQLGKDIRKLTEDWFRASAVHMYNLLDDQFHGNIMPYGLRNVFGVAVVLNDPDLIRLYLPWADRMFSGRLYHVDGMWMEGTVSYNQQTTGNALSALQLLKESFRDPPGYTDTKYGLRLDYTDLTSRYPILAKSQTMQSVLVFPDGSPVAIHDTWGKDPADKPGQIRSGLLKNIELWHFGHFALTGGDTDNATQVHLTFPPMAEGLPYSGGHYHGNHLGLILWGSGAELLPDAGYPKGKYRFFHMDAAAHNVPWIWSKQAEPYSSSAGDFTRPSLLAYDPGDRSGGNVRLVEASEPGPVRDGASMKRRLLMMVRLEGNRSYVVDLSRLRGGDAHEFYLRASEDEDTEFTASLPLDAYDGTVEDYMRRIGREEGLSSWRKLMREPRVGGGGASFQFDWTGVNSGSSVRAFMNGVPDGETIFSRIPTNRRTYNKEELMDAYPGWHLYRRRIVNPDDTTRYAAVYETVGRGQQSLIKTVRWEDSAPFDERTIAAVVESERFVDTVYISDDTKPRRIGETSLAGRAAVVRTDKQTGKAIWGYVYGQGTVRVNGFELKSGPDLRLEVTGAAGSLEQQSDNVLHVKGKLPKDDSLRGVWLRTLFGDGTGYGLRIQDARTPGVIAVHDHPALEVTERGAKMLFFPESHDTATGSVKLHRSESQYYSSRIVPGKVWADIQIPHFLTNEKQR